MIKQKPVVVKTIGAGLTYSEMGEIVCNSATPITIILPPPNAGLWYRISNMGMGIVTIYYLANLTTLQRTEQCLCLANSTTDWFFSKGGGDSGSLNLDGGRPDSNYGGVNSIDAGGV